MKTNNESKELLSLQYHTSRRNFINVRRIDSDIISIKIGEPEKQVCEYFLDKSEVEALIKSLNQ